MVKRQVNFRASELTRRQIKELQDWWGATQSEVITVAVDRAYREELARRGELDADNTAPGNWFDAARAIRDIVGQEGIDALAEAMRTPPGDPETD